ncbi:uncharacterized protein LY89DRAFT_710269 [Mollisia scopiformis]|uniref:Cyclase n=1 Tax=Mollisia scopiformis TaxID=149040 RepID=A0A194WTS8_MOLSC|nr:uncharacterized protein LY89DRAFT_710269 [Mollisia scopiformis]KUJ11094.1 hypothetical protein LY89DRAFT_710269 [Mollisia scopiformis]
MHPKAPSFDSLPLEKDGPRGNAWGLYGTIDELGMLNRLTPENTLAAMKEAVHGIRISTDSPLDRPKHIHHKHPRTVNDDILTLNTQSSSQWDGFRHFGYQDHKDYFNGCQQKDIQNSTRNGTHTWVDHGGIVGRGVLLDYFTWATSRNTTPPTPLSSTEITVADLLAGYVSALDALSASEAEAYAATQPHPAIGLRSCEESLRWIWESGFAAMAGDMPAFEALPFQSTEYWMHEWMLARWGLPIGELFDLERLAEECRRVEKWSFFFSSVPLKVPGGVASPPTGVAIL